MTTKASKEIQQKLEKYQQTIQKYQQTILSQPDADTSELDTLIQTVKQLITSVQSELGNRNSSTGTGIPAPFQKGVNQITASVEKIKTQIQQLQEKQTLDKHQEKVEQKLQTFETTFEQLRAKIKDYEASVQELCQQLLEAPFQTLKELQEAVTGQSSADSSEQPTISTSSELRTAIQQAQQNLEQLKTKLSALGINL
jgi:chromosome segregation ATPase